jgi:hypothetical protein
VLEALKQAGPTGLTDRELDRRLNCISSRYRTRRAELTAKGLVLDTGTTRTHGSNRRHIVWIHKDYAPEPP